MVFRSNITCITLSFNCKPHMSLTDDVIKACGIRKYVSFDKESKKLESFPSIFMSISSGSGRSDMLSVKSLCGYEILKPVIFFSTKKPSSKVLLSAVSYPGPSGLTKFSSK